MTASDPTNAAGDPASDDPRERCPSVSDGAKQFLAESEDLNEELFDLANIFRIPLTNNIPWFEDGDPEKPIYHVGEFMDAVKAAFVRHGWKAPE